MRPESVAIVGYGTAGQALSVFLQRQGLVIEHFERATELAPSGAGFLLQPTGLSVLEALGLAKPALACGARVDALVGHNHQQRLVMNMQYRQLRADWFGLGMQRGALFQLLHRANELSSRVRTGVSILRIDSVRRELIAADGRRYGPYELVVVADGTHSQLRASVPGLVRRETVYPWGALWCLLPDPDRTWTGVLRQRYRLAHTMMGILPVGAMPNDLASHKVCVYWSSPVRDGKVGNVRDLDDWRRQVHELWPEASPLLGTLDPSSFALNASSYRDVLVRPCYQGGVVLIGDAAHGMSPQLGQGVNMALLDAQALAAAIEHHTTLASALLAYDRERRSHLRAYQFLSRWLTPLFQSNHDALARVRDLTFEPIGRWPIARQFMLRILAGIAFGPKRRVDRAQ